MEGYEARHLLRNELRTILIPLRKVDTKTNLMIMQWKQQANDEYQARWQGMLFCLWLRPTTQRWELYVDGKKVKQDWRTVRDAKEQIERKQCKVIAAASVSLHHQQGTEQALGQVHA